MKGEFNMEQENAVATRMKEIAQQQKKKAVEIGRLGGLRQSTMSDILLGKNKYPRLNTIMRFCDGAGISMSEFFDSDLFRTTVDTPKKRNGGR